MIISMFFRLLTISLLLLMSQLTDALLSVSKSQSFLIVSDFGAIPDDGNDDSHAVREALDDLRKMKHRAILYFPPGKYDFFSDSASVVHYPVTAVHNQWDFVTPFHLDGHKDLTIDGGGATFIMHGRMTPFVINACRNVKVTRLSIEHVRPSVFELKVVEKGNAEIVYEAIGNDQFLLENNQLVWLDADDKRQISNVFQYYDPVKDITRRCPDPLQGAVSITKIDNNRIRVQYEQGFGLDEKIRIGEFFQFRTGLRNQSGVVVYESQNISFEDLNIYFWNGLGFVCQFCRDLTFTNLRMEPSPNSKRTNAGFADAIQIFACQGEIRIENSRFSGLQDDHINIYGQMMKVARVESEGKLRAVFTSNETEGFLNFRKGDKCVLRNPNSLEAEAEFKVLESKLLDNKTIRIKLAGDLTAKYQDYWIENSTWIPEKVTIRGNYFGRVPTRSILMYVAHEAVIENNTFHRIPMETILMKCPDGRYGLQNHVDKLIVRNNIFYECESALIKSNPQVQNLSEKANLYSTLVVKDNFIIMREKMPVFLNLRGFSKVDVGLNLIELSETHNNLANFSDCKEIYLSRQMILGVKDTAKVELNSVLKFSGDGWKVLEHDSGIDFKSSRDDKN